MCVRYIIESCKCIMIHYDVSVVNPENVCLCDYNFIIEKDFNLKKILKNHFRARTAVAKNIFFIGTYESNAFFVVEVGLDIITDAIKKFF